MFGWQVSKHCPGCRFVGVKEMEYDMEGRTQRGRGGGKGTFRMLGVWLNPFLTSDTLLTCVFSKRCAGRAPPQDSTTAPPLAIPAGLSSGGLFCH